MIKIRTKFIISELLIFILIAVSSFILVNSTEEIQIGETKYSKQTRNLYLSKFNNVDEVVQKVNQFYNIKVIDFGDNVITQEEKNYLIEKYPHIKLKVVSLIKINDQFVRDDTNYLDLSDYNDPDDIAKILMNFPFLEEVNLDNIYLTNQEIADLTKKYPKINFNVNITISQNIFNSNVEYLDLSGMNLDFEELNNAIKLFPILKSIDLSYSNLTNEECNQLRMNYPNIEINWVVHLGKWSLRTDAVDFSVLVYRFDYQRMTSEDIEVLKYCNKLKALDLGHQAITDVSVIGDYLTDLRILILADNKITDISPLAKLKDLHYLELFMNKISDLTPLKNSKQLVDLNISNLKKLSDITPILDLPKLERLWVTNCKVSEESYNILKKVYPNVQITITGYGSTDSGWRRHPRYYQMIDMFKKNYYGNEFSKYDN